jgi:hypothetical protein
MFAQEGPQNRKAAVTALHAELKRIAKGRATLDSQEATALTRAERMELWREYGYTTLLAYMEAELGYGPHAATERLRVARAVEQLPRLRARFDAGDLHYAVVRELTRIVLPETEERWLAAASGKNVREVEDLVSGRRPGDLPDSPRQPRVELHKIMVELTPAQLALFRQTRAALEVEQQDRLVDGEVIETLCRRMLAPCDSSRPPTQIAFMVCPKCRAATQDGAGMVADVPATEVERAMCDCEILGDVESPTPPRILKTVSPRLRRQVLARDRHRCVVSGCRNARNIEVHHIHFKSRGGSNKMENLITMCTGHHTMLHEGRIVMTGKPPLLSFKRRPRYFE